MNVKTPLAAAFVAACASPAAAALHLDVCSIIADADANIGQRVEVRGTLFSAGHHGSAITGEFCEARLLLLNTSFIVLDDGVVTSPLGTANVEGSARGQITIFAVGVLTRTPSGALELELEEMPRFVGDR